MKRYILIAGVNGAGKSTLYQTLSTMKGMPRVNTDEILRKFGDWKNPRDLIRAGKIAVTMLGAYLDQGVSFNQETTLCGRSLFRNITRAKQNGYSIELHYIGVASADVAKERVRFRVAQGGHGIPEELIEKRYEESLLNLGRVLPQCDLAVLYDNTDKFRRFAIYRKGKAARISHSIPTWYKKYLAAADLGQDEGELRRRKI